LGRLLDGQVGQRERLQPLVGMGRPLRIEAPNVPAARRASARSRAWRAIGMAGVVGLACCLLEPIRRTKATLARRRQARRRAEALLLGWLSPDQRRKYQAHGWFEVTTTRGYRYRVLRGGSYGWIPADWRIASKRPSRCRLPKTGLIQRLITHRAQLVGLR
jgi:hypothetical protein